MVLLTELASLLTLLVILTELVLIVLVFLTALVLRTRRGWASGWAAYLSEISSPPCWKKVPNSEAPEGS